MGTDLQKEQTLLLTAKTDKEGFNELYKYFLNDVYRFSYSLVNNQADAEDITSQTFIELYKKIDSFVWQGISLKYWLFRTTKNLALKSFRQLKATQLDESYIVPGDYEVNFVDEIIEKDLVERIKEEIKQLHPVERSIINLRIWEGMSFKEIGELNNSSEDAVRMRFNRSIQKIKDSLEQKNIKRLLILPVLLTTILKAGASTSYAAPASLASIDFTTVISTHMTALTTFKSFLASKAGVAAITATVAVTATAGVVSVVYNQPKQQKETTANSQTVPTPEPSNIKTTVTTTLTSTPTSTPITSYKPQIPQGWSVKTSSTCNAKLPLPPKALPYYNGNDFWQYEEYETPFLFTEVTSRLIYKDDSSLGSGNVQGDVEVLCAPNTKGYTAESLYTFLDKEIKTKKDPGYTFIEKIASKTDSKMWGQDVKILKFQSSQSLEDPNQEYYLFATRSNIYIVRKITGSTDTNVKNTTNQIFNNLEFTNP